MKCDPADFSTGKQGENSVQIEPELGNPNANIKLHRNPITRVSSSDTKYFHENRFWNEV